MLPREMNLTLSLFVFNKLDEKESILFVSYLIKKATLASQALLDIEAFSCNVDCLCLSHCSREGEPFVNSCLPGTCINQGIFWSAQELPSKSGWQCVSHHIVTLERVRTCTWETKIVGCSAKQACSSILIEIFMSKIVYNKA